MEEETDNGPQEEYEIAVESNDMNDVNRDSRKQRARIASNMHKELCKRTKVIEVEVTPEDVPLLDVLRNDFGIEDVSFKQVVYGYKRRTHNSEDQFVRRGILDKKEFQKMNKNSISLDSGVTFHDSVVLVRENKSQKYCHIYKDGYGDVAFIHLF